MQLSAQSKSCQVSLCRAVSSQVSIFRDGSSTISLGQHLILDTVIFFPLLKKFLFPSIFKSQTNVSLSVCPHPSCVLSLLVTIFGDF